MTLWSLYILDEKGNVLIFRDFCESYGPTKIKQFFSVLTNMIEDGQMKPIINLDNLYFIHMKHKNIYFVGICPENSNIAMDFTFIYKTKNLLIDYFTELEEESVKDNFVIIYELLDEIIDFGIPQITESKILHEYITQESCKLQIARPPMAVTNAVSWRGDNIRHRRNQIFVDVVEQINCLMTKDGTVLSCDINGVIKCDCQLSGMPELRMGFNDMLAMEKSINIRARQGTRIELEDIKFHQCVRLASFETERKISFIPPDGKFDLMSYRIPFSGRPPFLISQNYDIVNPSHMKFRVRIMSTFKNDVSASTVDVKIPVPPDVVNPKFTTGKGRCTYMPEYNLVKWSIRSFVGQKETELIVEFNLPTINQGSDVKTPISVEFEINYYSASRIQICYMKISEKSGYEAFPWVRYITYNGDYQVRGM